MRGKRKRDRGKERFKKEEYKRERERRTFEYLSWIPRDHCDWEGAVGLAVGLGVSDLFVCVCLSVGLAVSESDVFVCVFETLIGCG